MYFHSLGHPREGLEHIAYTQEGTTAYVNQSLKLYTLNTYNFFLSIITQNKTSLNTLRELILYRLAFNSSYNYIYNK